MAKSIRNIASNPKVSKNEARKIVLKEIWQRELNTDDIQVVKKTSSGINALSNYGPAPTVGE